MKYQEWLEEWLESYTKISTKFRTYKRYTEIVHQHIVPRLGDKEMKELTPLDFQHFVTYLLKSGNARTKQGLSANTVNSIITVVQNSLKIAFMLGYVDSYVGDKIKRPKADDKSTECFTLEEQSFATRALECGMDVKTLSEILRHKNPTVTLNRYAHSMMEHKKSLMNKLGKSLKI